MAKKLKCELCGKTHNKESAVLKCKRQNKRPVG